jgi:hypothetical protein
MSSHHTPLGEPQQASAAHALVVAQTSDLRLACLWAGLSARLRSIQPDPAGRGNTPETGPSAADWLDPVVGQFAVVYLTRHALLRGLASSARFAVNRPIRLCVAHTQWPGQTTAQGGSLPLTRTLGRSQCTARSHWFAGSPRTAFGLCNEYSLPGCAHDSMQWAGISNPYAA